MLTSNITTVTLYKKKYIITYQIGTCKKLSLYVAFLSICQLRMFFKAEYVLRSVAQCILLIAMLTLDLEIDAYYRGVFFSKGKQNYVT